MYNNSLLIIFFRLWSISREVGLSGLMRDSWNNLEYLRGNKDIRDFMPFIICPVMSYQVTWVTPFTSFNIRPVMFDQSLLCENIVWYCNEIVDQPAVIKIEET